MKAMNFQTKQENVPQNTLALSSKTDGSASATVVVVTFIFPSSLYLLLTDWFQYRRLEKVKWDLGWKGRSWFELVHVIKSHGIFTNSFKKGVCIKIARF